MPDLKVSENVINYGDITLLNPVTKTISVENIGRVISRFKFASSSANDMICKPWFHITPQAGMLLPGEVINVVITISVSGISAQEVNFNGLDDILILHVENGKDHFISLGGQWIVSTIGNSIGVLCATAGPISAVPFDECKRLYKELKNTETPANELSSASIQKSSVPKEIWRLIDFIFRYGLVIVFIVYYILI